eukprot:15377-Heterococcus_DN1.PRE.6
MHSAHASAVHGVPPSGDSSIRLVLAHCESAPACRIACEMHQGIQCSTLLSSTSTLVVLVERCHHSAHLMLFALHVTLKDEQHPLFCCA